MLVTGSALVNELAGFVRDTSHARWSLAEKWSAINHVVNECSTRVRFPVPYDLSLVVGTNSYALPDWAMDLPGELLLYSDDDYTSGVTASYERWNRAGLWSLRTDDTAGVMLDVRPRWDSSAQYIAWASNPVMPQGTFTVSSLDADGTSLTVTTAETDYEFGNVGFIKLDNEWILYRGVNAAGYPGTLILQSLVRAQDGTAAATHSDATLYWGFWYDQAKLRTVMRLIAVSYLMNLPIINAASQELAHFQWNLRWATQETMTFWRRYQPGRSPRVMPPAERGIQVY